MPLSRKESDALRGVLARWPLPPVVSDCGALLRAAEYHGLAGILSDSLLAAGLPVDEAIRMRELAREIDHAAHMSLLQKIDEAFSRASLQAVSLKGALFGERFYPRPSARVTGDIDLLVRTEDLEKAQKVLQELGYRGPAGIEQERERREHHHLHLFNPLALPLELHFHAYRGFGGILSSDTLVARSVPFRPFRSLSTLSSDDEVVYLATHAASHMFGRWSWLFDLRLLIEALTAEEIAAAGCRAKELGFERPIAAAARLLVSIMGMSSLKLAPLGSLGPIRWHLVESLLQPPRSRAVAAASRLLYTTSLCSSTTSSAWWVASELRRHGRDLMWR